MPTSDNRLLRRMVRDSRYRGVSATETIRRWPSVRRGEDKWIYPYQENADAMFNSSLIFELSVIKEYAEELLRGVPRDIPEYAEAYRLRTLLGYFTPITDKTIPSTSLLRGVSRRLVIPLLILTPYTATSSTIYRQRHKSLIRDFCGAVHVQPCNMPI